jgi:hypothetical protein
MVSEECVDSGSFGKLVDFLAVSTCGHITTSNVLNKVHKTFLCTLITNTPGDSRLTTFATQYVVEIMIVRECIHVS